ncbi:MAG: lytic polysaccharide monooxygenase [Bdellovibrionaceae bacterium]|nr:lytic polysaccharide monooxygenase [Pseudobdellovibrionaceae bacterium]
MKYLTSLFTVISFSNAFSHTRWQVDGSLPPRTDDSGIKSSSAPCGIRKFNTRTALKSGQELTIQWEETIDHPGHFEIWFSMENDDNWALLKTIIDDQSGRNNASHFFTNSISVPDVTCDNCTLQIRQIMTDRNPPTLYYSCADVQISPNNPPVIVKTPIEPPLEIPPMTPSAPPGHSDCTDL